MVRGREETSTSGCPGGRPRAKPSASNIIASMTMEELKVYCEVPDNIDLWLMEGVDESTLGGEHNGVFFTREYLVSGLRFPVSAIVKQFLHFTRAPSALIHPNLIRILIGCCVLNHLYQLDLTLVELFIIYLLNIGSGWLDVHVSLEPPTSYCERAPRLAQNEGKMGVISEGSLGLNPGFPRVAI